MNVSYRVCAIGDETASDLDGQIAAHLRAGLTGIELRTIDSRYLHELSGAEIAAAARAIEAAGLVVPVVDTPVGSWSVTVATDMRTELDTLRNAAEASRRLGCDRLRVMSYPSDGRAESEWRSESLRRMRRLAHLAEELDVYLLHENCQGWASQNVETTLEMLREVDSPRLRLLFDMGNGLSYGYEAPVFLRDILPWVEHVHVRDGLRSATPAGPRYVLPGAGEAGIAVCCEMLIRAGYCGWFSLEPHIGLVPHDGLEASAEYKLERHSAAVASLNQLLGDVSGRRSESRTGLVG